MSILIREKQFYKRFFAWTFSIALQNLIVFGINLSDNLMIGSYSETALSGVALANQIQFLLQMLTVGVGEGIIVLASQYWGKRELEPVRCIISIGLRIAVSIGFLFWLLIFLFPHATLGLLTNDEAVIAEGAKYLRIICFSYVFFTISNTLITGLRSVEIVKVGFVVPIFTLTVNVILNYALIYGHWGAPELGIRGSAVATLSARIIEFFVVLCYMVFLEKRLLFRLRNVLSLNRTLLGDYFRVASPVILSNALWGIAMAIQTSILARMGSDAIAANSIATTLFQILSVVSYGIASAASIIIGKTVGEGNLERGKEYAKAIQVIALAVGFVTGGLLWLLRDVLLQFYSISPDTKQLAELFITVLSVTVCGTSYEVTCLVGIVRGGGDTKFVLYNDMIFMWLIVLPASALAAFWLNLSPVVVFICLKSDQILKCFVAVIKVNRFRWMKQLTR